MSYCQKCGAEVSGNFCPECGTQVGTAGRVSQQIILHENCDIKPIFDLKHMILAGYLGLGFLGATLIFLAVAIPELGGFTPIEVLATFLIIAFFFFLAFLAYLPGIKAVCKRSPKGKVRENLTSFLIKSVFFLFSWCLTITLCVYLVGIIFRIWKFGMWATYPRADQYVVFRDGQKIPVTRYEDNLIGYGANTGYIYQDAKGVYYRPGRK